MLVLKLFFFLVIFQSGYVDGITAGKDSVFQDGFDKGYEDGFTNAFKLGFLAYELPIENITRGNCQICQDKSLLNLSISKLSKHQSSDFSYYYQQILKHLD